MFKLKVTALSDYKSDKSIMSPGYKMLYLDVKFVL